MDVFVPCASARKRSSPFVVEVCVVSLNTGYATVLPAHGYESVVIADLLNRRQHEPRASLATRNTPASSIEVCCSLCIHTPLGLSLR